MKNLALPAALYVALIVFSHQPAFAQDRSAVAGAQARVESLTTGILAGSLKPGHSNGFRTAVSFDGPNAIAADSAGNIFVADGYAVRKITPDGRTGNFAGSTNGYTDGPGITARFGEILGLAVDSDDNIYVADAYTRRIRKITPSGYVSTLAGSTTGFHDGIGADAQFTLPRAIAVDRAGNVYVADDKVNKIRKITPDGKVATLAAYEKIVIEQTEPTVNGCAALEDLKSGAAETESSIRFVNNTENPIHLYWIDYKREEVLYQTLSAGESHNQPTFYNHQWVVRDDTGRCLSNFEAGTHAQFTQPRGVAVDTSGVIYVLDGITLKRIDPDEIAVDGVGHEFTGSVRMMTADLKFNSAANHDNRAIFEGRGGIIVDDAGNIYVTSTRNKNLVMITPEGVRNEIVRSDETQWIGQPNDVALAANGNFYFSDNHNHVVHQLTPAGNVGPLPGIDIPEPEAKAPQSVLAAQPATEKEPITLLDTIMKVGMSDSRFGDLVGDRELTHASDTAPGPGVQVPQAPAPRSTVAAQPMSKEESVALFKSTKTQAKNDLDALFELGKMYEEGRGVRRDPLRASSTYKKGAKKGHAGAQFEHGLRHLDGTIPYMMVVSNGDVAAGEAKQLAKRRAAAADWYTKSADQGYGPAEYGLAWLYFRGHGVEKNSERAIELLTLAAGKGNFDAQFELAEIYRKGEGVEADLSQAIKWYRHTSDQGDFYSTVIMNALIESTAASDAVLQVYADARAQTELALQLYAGTEVERDFARAAKLFEEPAILGNTTAQRMLGLMYLNGEGVDPDLGEAARWLNFATQLGDADARFWSAYQYERGLGVPQDFDRATYWYELAAGQDNLLAQMSLGYLYYADEKFGVDHAASLDWYGMAAAQGDPQAQYNAGWLHLSGGHDDEQSVARAASRFGDAAAQGHLEATRMAAVTARAADGDAGAQYELGRKFKEGREVPRSPHDAMFWYTKSAEQGYPDGQYELGMMTRYSAGEIPQDIVASAAWLQVAADAGHAEAGIELEKLKAEITREEERRLNQSIESVKTLIEAIKNRDK